MNMTSKYKTFAAILTFAIMAANPAFSDGLNNEAWSFSPQNRASIASLIKQTEDRPSQSTTSGYGYGSLTTMICGDGSATAKGNSSCILLNNSTGVIDLGQDSDGDQTATSDITDTTNNAETTVVKEPNLADILSSLSED